MAQTSPKLERISTVASLIRDATLLDPPLFSGAHAIVPKANKPKQKIEGLTIVAVERVEEAVEYCRGG